MSLEGKTQEEIQALAALADDVLSKPDTAGVFQRLVKKNNPGVSMPLVELEDKAAAAFLQRDQKIDALTQRLAQSDAEKSANSLYDNLREGGYVNNRDGFSELVSWASENGFMTTEMGLRKAAMQRSHEKEAAEPTPQTFGNGVFSLVDGNDAKDFLNNPVAAARNRAAQAMDELRKMRATGKTH